MSVEPVVFETGGRIPHTPTAHNSNGSCCITVWEYWLAKSADKSFRAYLTGPIRNYFLGQFLFEKTGEWPFGEWSHGGAGLVEAFADLLGIEADRTKVIRYLESVAGKPKGHQPCPCGAKKILRECHQQHLHTLYAEIGPKPAAQMLARVKTMAQ